MTTIETIKLRTEDDKIIVVNRVDYDSGNLPPKWADAIPADEDTPTEPDDEPTPEDEAMEIAEATSAPWLDDAVKAEDDED